MYYNQLDANRDGKVTAEDYRMMAHRMGMGQLGQAMAVNTFNQMDTNRDGVLSRDEYQRHMANANYGPFTPYPQSNFPPNVPAQFRNNPPNAPPNQPPRPDAYGNPYRYY